MVRWAVELSKFDIQYEPRGSIKGQVYADFVAELSPGGDLQEVEAGAQWMLSVDDYSNQQESGAGIILEGPNGVLIEQALRFAFKASNNQAEYEALIVGMLLAKEMGAQSLLAKSDSQLVTRQVTGGYQAKDTQMAAYLRYVEVLKRAFAAFELVHVPREQNSRADLLAKLASSGKGGKQRTVIQETLKTSRKFVADNRVDVLHVSTTRGKPRSHRSLSQETVRVPCISTYVASPDEERSVQVCALEEGDTWMTPYRRYLADGILQTEPEEGKKTKRNVAKYTLVDGILFRHGFTHPILTCVSGDKCTRIMAELHEDEISDRWHRIFHQVDRGRASGTDHRPQGTTLCLENIICRFGVPRRLISDNGTQFASQQLGKLCTEVGINKVFASVEHPQTNGQVKSANRVLLRGLKRRLEKAKRARAEEVSRIVWAYHTMPQSSTMETPFSLVYGSDAMIPVEIHESSPRFLGFVAEESNEERRVNLDLIDEAREEAKIKAEAVKRRVERQYSSKVKLRQF
ncbi:uncharacterized protein [Phaseolus vulgaris]|uniref:uncharacterized protein n=1 Tax=Phaseolus vulgaris TaxID=3885 RepID=UPI0035CC0E44